jgi:predicted metal-dependent hydrolase
LVLDLFDPPVVNSVGGSVLSTNKDTASIPNLDPTSKKIANGFFLADSILETNERGHFFNNEKLNLSVESTSLQSKAKVTPSDLPVKQVQSQVNLFRHPDAKRVIVLRNTEIAYAFRRAKRKTIGMSVGYDGLTVSAPRWVGWGEIESALQGRADWIVRKIVEMQEKQKFLSKRKLVWANGETLPILGVEVEIVLDPAHSFNESGGVLKSSTGKVLNGLGEVAEGCKLYLGLALSAHSIQIQDAVQAWLMRQAKLLFKDRLDQYAPQLNVTWTKLSLSSASTRWGSAGSDGAIRLNWRLIHFKMDVIDYVVVHELSHLRVMDHSPRFWDTVKEVVPDFKERRAVLSDKPVPIWT